MLALLLTALSAPVNVRVMVPGGLDGYWAQKIELFESMKRDQGEEVKVLVAFGLGALLLSLHGHLRRN